MNPAMFAAAQPVAKAAAAGLAIGVMLFCIAFALAVYLFFCFCYKRICEKCGQEPGILIWIPIVQAIPLIQAAKLPLWTIILALIPFVNIVFMFVLWYKLFEARGKSGWLVLLFIIPITAFILIPWLAFSNGAPAAAPVPVEGS
ncbi:MAG: hypothetical protein HY300_09865 [Verrucomicrobia bacterium]|nr:hypothetical protein [Verrucomicrobiota bacterium]